MAANLEQRIRERAYEIWENEGCPEGRGDEHWQQACAEFRDALTEAQEEAGPGAGTGPEGTASLSQEPGAELDGAARSS